MTDVVALIMYGRPMDKGNGREERASHGDFDDSE